MGTFLGGEDAVLAFPRAVNSNPTEGGGIKALGNRTTFRTIDIMLLDRQ